jgi:exonuclease VII large subunit
MITRTPLELDRIIVHLDEFANELDSILADEVTDDRAVIALWAAEMTDARSLAAQLRERRQTTESGWRAAQHLLTHYSELLSVWRDTCEADGDDEAVESWQFSIDEIDLLAKCCA